jgi:hypothetical protein
MGVLSFWRCLAIVILASCALAATPQAASTPNPPSPDATTSDLMEVVFKQEQLIARLETTTSKLQLENEALREEVRLLNAASSSMDSVGSAAHSALKAEVLRLTRKLSLSPRRAREAKEGGDSTFSHEDQWTRPQHVSIHCKEAADVALRPLSEDDRGADECLVLEVRAPDVDARFVLYCGADEVGDDGAGDGGSGTGGHGEGS